MPRYLLLLHEDPADYAEMSPEEIQRIIEKYRAWSQGLAEAGKLVDSEKLREDGGKRLHAEEDRVVVTDGPYAEGREIIGGFFLIDAADYDDACAIAGGCPHLEGGWIELREIDPV